MQWVKRRSGADGKWVARPWGHQTRTHSHRSDRRHRGVAILEAAFITPVFLVMVLGIVEIGLAMNDYLAVASSVRSGARLASAYGNDSYADYAILHAVLQEASALDKNNIRSIVIFKPTGFGDKPSALCQTSGSQTDLCNVYPPSAFTADKTLYVGCTPTGALDKAAWRATS